MSEPVTDRRAPMSVGFWIGHGPRQIILPFTFAALVGTAGLTWKAVDLYGKQKAMAAALDARTTERDNQIAQLKMDVTTLKDDVSALRTNAITREDVNDIKAQIAELRSVLLRGRE